MIDVTPKCREYHDAYVRITGLQVNFSSKRIFTWECFIAQGWNIDDIKMAVRHLQSKIAKRQKWTSCLLFSNLIENTGNFEEALSEARAMSRTPKPHPAHRELCATGRPAVKESAPARSLEQIIEGEKAFAQFRQLKSTL